MKSKALVFKQNKLLLDRCLTIFRNEKNSRIILQIDVNKILKKPSMFEDIMDIVIAISRKDEKDISWNKVKEKLKKSGRF